MWVLAETFWGVGLLFWTVCTESCAPNRVVALESCIGHITPQVKGSCPNDMPWQSSIYRQRAPQLFQVVFASWSHRTSKLHICRFLLMLFFCWGWVFVIYFVGKLKRNQYFSWSEIAPGITAPWMISWLVCYRWCLFIGHRYIYRTWVSSWLHWGGSLPLLALHIVVRASRTCRVDRR